MRSSRCEASERGEGFLFFPAFQRALHLCLAPHDSRAKPSQPRNRWVGVFEPWWSFTLAYSKSFLSKILVYEFCFSQCHFPTSICRFFLFAVGQLRGSTSPSTPSLPSPSTTLSIPCYSSLSLSLSLSLFLPLSPSPLSFFSSPHTELKTPLRIKTYGKQNSLL